MSGRWQDWARCWPMFWMTYDVTDDLWIQYVWFHYIKRMSDICLLLYTKSSTLQWRHNERRRVSNHQFLECLLNRLFRRRSKKTPKFSVNGLCEGNLPMTGEFLAQRARYAENISICWRHHDVNIYKTINHLLKKDLEHVVQCRNQPSFLTEYDIWAAECSELMSVNCRQHLSIYKYHVV